MQIHFCVKEQGLASVVIERNLVMNEKLFNVKLSLKFSPHNTQYDRVYVPTSTLYLQKNDILGSWLIVCCKYRSNFSQTNVTS